VVSAKLFNEVGLPTDPLLGFGNLLIDSVEITLCRGRHQPLASERVCGVPSLKTPGAAQANFD
jgi:hypothetical protein